MRDRALLLVGWAGALRRSELVALECRDVRWEARGMVLLIRRSKTDQSGEGAELPVPYGSSAITCPVRTLRAWLETAGIADGPLFRGVDQAGNVAAGALTGRSVARIVKRHAEAVGLDPEAFAGHSLRAGFVTTAAERGVSERRIMEQTRHASEAMVHRYTRIADRWRDSAVGEVGL